MRLLAFALISAVVIAQIGPQIFEANGRIGTIAIGSPQPRSPLPSGITVVTDRRGIVTSMTCTVRGMFTQRYVTIGQSTLNDVVSRYGKANSVRSEGSTIALEYAVSGRVVTFRIDNSSASRLPSDRRPVLSITLR